jgi:hypothetical protein
MSTGIRKPSVGRPGAFDPEEEDIDSIPEADRALFGKRVLERYARGVRPDTIAFEEHVGVQTVYEVIREAARQVREESREFVEHKFLQQDLGVQHLIVRCMEAVERAAAHDPPILHCDAIKLLIQLYDRQAKLTGIDRARNPEREPTGMDWLKTASEDDLKKRAKNLGIRLPESILAPSPDA